LLLSGVGVKSGAADGWPSLPLVLPDEPEDEIPLVKLDQFSYDSLSLLVRQLAQRDLHASYADVQWALAGYTLAYALVLITGGRLGDMFGRKRLFLIGWPASPSCPRCAARPPARAC
jgi:MFS family permease